MFAHVLRRLLGGRAGGFHGVVRDAFRLGAGGVDGFACDLRGAAGVELGFGLGFKGGVVGLAHEASEGAPYLGGDVLAGGWVLSFWHDAMSAC